MKKIFGLAFVLMIISIKIYSSQPEGFIIDADLMYDVSKRVKIEYPEKLNKELATIEMKVKEYILYHKYFSAPNNEYCWNEYYLYNLKTKEAQRIFQDKDRNDYHNLPTITWFFSEKMWIMSYAEIYDLSTKEFRSALPTINQLTNEEREKLNKISYSYSYTGPYIYYVNPKTDELTERDLETLEDKVIFDFRQTEFKDKMDQLELGPRSPDGKYMPIYDRGPRYDADGKVYLINLETKEIRFVAGRPFLSYFLCTGKEPQKPLFWDKTSKYLIFYTDYNWFNLAYHVGDCSAYNVDDGSLRQLNDGFKVGNFWFSWE